MSCYIESGQVSSGITLNGDTMYVSSGGTANETTVNIGGRLYVSSGGVANDTTLGQLAGLHVSQGGTANGVIANNLGDVYVNGGTVNDAVLKKTCSMCVYDGGVANDTVLSSGGAVRVSQGGTANGVIVSKGGTAYIFQGGATNDAVVSNDGEVHVSQGGTLNSVTVNGGGRVFLSQGAKLTGQVTIIDDPSVEGGIGAEDGSIVDFDLSTVAPGSTARINNMTMIYGSPDYTITISTTIQRVGDYTLTEESGNFFGTFTVKSTVGATLGTLGTIGIDDTLQCGDYTYSLSKTEGALTLTITSSDTTDPLPPTIKANKTALTNKDVILTATFSADSAKKQYSTDNRTWNSYTSAITVSNNGTWYFRGIDEAGNISEVTEYTVTNIDKVAPDAPAASASTTKLTNQNVTVTAEFSDDSELQQYSLDGDTWSAYTTGVVLSANGTVYFRGIDEVGNVSDVTEYIVSNIDRVAPVKPTVSADITAPTNQDVTITATCDSDDGIMEYSFDFDSWNSYTDGVVMSENGTVFFRAHDAADNVSGIAIYTVTNIDKIAPVRPSVNADITAPTNCPVTVTATFSSDTAQKQYSLNNSTWQSYTTGVVMSANGTVYFRGIDEAGNISDVAEYTVSNIDKVAPTAPTVKASTTKLTNQNITVTATFSEDSAQKQYSTDKKTWKTYSSALTVSANGTYYFRGIDEAGNISDVTAYKVANIDKLMPTVKVSTTAPTNKNVTITATFTKDAAKKQYSTDKKTWKTYSAALTVSANGTYYFRGVDKNNKASTIVTLKVANIDKTAPKAPTVKASTTKATNKDVTITATFSTDSAKKQYSADNKTWKTYSKALSVAKNGTYYFRGVDAAGNVSKVTTIKVANIDKTAPKAPTVKVSTTKATNKSITVTATFSTDSAKKQYSTDNKTWKTYSKALAVKANGTYYFRGVDAAGNVSKVKNVKVANVVDTANNNWSGATALKGTVLGALEAKADSVDYYNVGDVAKLMIDMEKGKAKVSFYDANKKAVKVSALTMANGSVRKNVSALTLTTGNGTTDNFTVAALDDAVKYLKIETADKSLDCYKLAKLA